MAKCSIYCHSVTGSKTMPHGLVPTDFLWPQRQSESQQRFIWIGTLAKLSSWCWAQMFLLAWDPPIWDCINLSYCQFLPRTLFYFIKINRLLASPCLVCQIHTPKHWIQFYWLTGQLSTLHICVRVEKSSAWTIWDGRCILWFLFALFFNEKMGKTRK